MSLKALWKTTRPFNILSVCSLKLSIFLYNCCSFWRHKCDSRYHSKQSCLKHQVANQEEYLSMHQCQTLWSGVWDLYTQEIRNTIYSLFMCWWESYASFVTQDSLGLWSLDYNFYNPCSSSSSIIHCLTSKLTVETAFYLHTGDYILLILNLEMLSK